MSAALQSAPAPAETTVPVAATHGSQIIRLVKDRAHPFAQIANTVLNDRRLSIAARGVLCYLLSKPDTWQVRCYELQHATNLGRDALRAVLRELEAAGYLIRQCTHGAGGRWVWESVVYEAPPFPAAVPAPAPENPATVAPSPAPPAPAPPSPVQPLVNEYVMRTHTEDNKTESIETQHSPAPVSTVRSLIRKDGEPGAVPATPVPTPAEAALAPLRGLPASSYVVGVIMDYSREFGDLAHDASNATQALRLWQESQLPEAAFVERLHAARQRTRAAQGRQGTGFLTHKMAYYFQVLRELLTPNPGAGLNSALDSAP